MTNPKQYLDSLKALEACATPGPWLDRITPAWNAYDPESYYAVGPTHGQTPRHREHIDKANADAAFIAASRNALPLLIAALEEAVGALEVCDLALKAAKPCVTGGRDMNENIAADALSRVNTLIGEVK